MLPIVNQFLHDHAVDRYNVLVNSLAGVRYPIISISFQENEVRLAEAMETGNSILAGKMLHKAISPLLFDQQKQDQAFRAEYSSAIGNAMCVYSVCDDQGITNFSYMDRPDRRESDLDYMMQTVNIWSPRVDGARKKILEIRAENTAREFGNSGNDYISIFGRDGMGGIRLECPYFFTVAGGFAKDMADVLGGIFEKILGGEPKPA